MIVAEFLTIAGRALRDHRGADSVTVTSVEPTEHGPRVRWEGPLLARERRRDPMPGGGFTIGPPAGPLLLDILALATAFRWADGAPRCAKDWSERLARRYRRVFGPTGPATGPGWSWLWEAGGSVGQGRWAPRRLPNERRKGKVRRDALVRGGRHLHGRRRHRRRGRGPLRPHLRGVRRPGAPTQGRVDPHTL